MKILITGGAGFIGSHLADALIGRGDDVTVLDDLSTGFVTNLDPVRDHPGFTLRVGSCLDRPLVAELVDRADVTVHLAAAVGVRLVVDKPVHTIETNVGATEVVLDAAARKGKKVVVASTSEVYGKSSKVPFAEDDDVTLGSTARARWAYGCSKALDEWLAFAYHRERGLPFVIVRFFNTVGPRQTGRYGMVLPTFVDQALSGVPITVYGSGEQARCFAHVRDSVDSLVRLMDHPGAVGKVFNIGSTEEVTIRELAELVKKISNSASPIELISYDDAYADGFEDMPRRIPDVRRLEELTGYRPRTPLSETIRDLIAERTSSNDRQ